MANESGDLKLLGNFRKLIDFVPADTYYNPADADITDRISDPLHRIAGVG
jgi:hypothetical protein